MVDFGSWMPLSGQESKDSKYDPQTINNAFNLADNGSREDDARLRMHTPTNYQWESPVFLASHQQIPIVNGVNAVASNRQFQHFDAPLSNDPLRRQTNHQFAEADIQYPERENECLMRIAELQRQIEILKLEMDEGHDRLRSLGDKEERAEFIKERVGNKWIVEGLTFPKHTEANIDCGEKDNIEVFVRDCEGSMEFGNQRSVVVKIQGSARRITVSRCRYLHLTVESCSLDILLKDCENVSVIFGGHAPNINVEDSHDIELELCYHLMVDKLTQTRSYNLTLVGCERQGIPILSTKEVEASKYDARTIIDVPSDVQLVLRCPDAGGMSTLTLPYCTVKDKSNFPPPPEWARYDTDGQLQAVSRCLLPGIV